MNRKHKQIHGPEKQSKLSSSKSFPERERTIRIVGWAGITLIILNLVLFSFRKTTMLQFWITLIIISIASLGALYLLKKQN